MLERDYPCTGIWIYGKDLDETNKVTNIRGVNLNLQLKSFCKDYSNY